MELKQRKLLKSNKFLIRDNGIEWTYKQNFSLQNTFFEFDELNFKKSTKYKNYNLALIILSVLSIIGLIFSIFPTSEDSGFGEPTIIMFLPLAIIFSLLSYAFHTNNLYIPTERGVNIIMYNGLPNKKKFSIFLKQLKSEAKKSVMKKYFDDKDVDKKKLYNFMEERGLLDDTEKQKFELVFEQNKPNTVTGFGKN